MNVFKRSMVSIYRQPVKSLFFLVLVITLSSLTAGAVLVQQAITNTDQNLRNRMPAIVTVAQDERDIYETTGEWPPCVTVSPELIRQIGEFEEVRSFDYAIDIRWSVTAPDLRLWENPNFPFPFGPDYDEDLGVRLRVEGVGQSNFLDMRHSFVELLHGRSFNEKEMEIGVPPFPVLVASGFAETNEFSVGSVFETQIVIFETIKMDNELLEIRDNPPLVEASFPVEIIGIFEPITANLPEGADIDDTFQADRWESLMQHRLFVPNIVAEMMFEVQRDDPQTPEHIWIQNFFLLEDPLYFNSFALKVAELEGNWHATDFSSGFRSISVAMRDMQGIANFILGSAVGATLSITGLLVSLLLRERKFEIGVYLALGEKKKKIICQMFIELMPLVMIGMTVALILGNSISTILSHEMLRRNMLESQNPFLVLEEGTPLEYFGYRFELNQEEMLDSFEFGIDLNSAFKFYTIVFSTVTIAIIIPISYAVHQKPYKLLLNKVNQ
jgi:putative ABC transport system permease protein